MTHVTATATGRRQTRRFIAPVVALIAVAMLGAVLALAGSTPRAQAQVNNTTCYTINDGVGTMVSWNGGAPTTVGETGLTGIESLAANQDRNELWSYDDDTQSVYVFTPGSATPTSQFGFTAGGFGGLDGLTWVNHVDGDPSNDQLWGTIRNGLADSTNEADEIVQLDPATGDILSGPTTITDPGAGSDELDDNDGLIWDPQTGTVFGVIGGDTTPNDLIEINPATGDITLIDLTLDGGSIFDIESLGAGTDGQLYGTTGEDNGPDGNTEANQFIQIDKSSGAVTVLGAFPGGTDYEATACLTEDVTPPISITPATCYTIDEGNGANDNNLVRLDIAADGSFTGTDLGVVDNGTTPTVNVESLAYRNGFEPQALYTIDPATGDLLRINEDDGTDTVIVLNGAFGDIDGLTWRLDNNDNPADDQLWATIRNGGGAQDELIQIDPVTGALLSGPTTIQTTGAGARNNVDGLAWDPTTDTLYSPINGSGLDNDLITIDPATGAVTIVGSIGVQDIEGLGFTDDGQLFGTVGNDGDSADNLVLIDKATGAGTLLGTIPFYDDFESFDCAGEAPVALQPSLDIRLDVIPAGETCPADFASATEDVGPLLPVEIGDEVTYCFKVINNGPGDAFDVTVTHPQTGAVIDLGDIAAGEEAMDMVNDIIEEGDGESTATVTGDNSAGDPVTPAEDPAGVDPADPVLEQKIGNFVWRDNNRDGIQDADEPGIEGVQVTVWAVEDDGTLNPTPVGTVLTDVDGMWMLAVDPGDYRVAFAKPDGSDDFSPQDTPDDDEVDSDAIQQGPADAGFTDIYTVTAGVDNFTIDAGIIFPVGIATIGNFVWVDTNGDGIQDADEPGIAGIVVEIADADGNPVGQTSTNDDGLWSFDVDPGTYVVTFINSTAGEFTQQNTGDGTNDSDADALGVAAAVTVAEGDSNQTIDAGIVFPVAPAPAIALAKQLSDGPARIAGTDNYNVTYTFIIENIGDVDLTGVTLTDNVGIGLADTPASVVTGPTPNASGCSVAVAEGTQNLAVGDSCVAIWSFVISNPTGVAVEFDNSATVAGNPPTGDPVTDVSDDGAGIDPNGNGNADEDGENDPTPAEIPAQASLGDKVFVDANENGAQDDGEAPVAGLTVNLLNAAGDTLATTQTDAAGMYSFTNLEAGDYIVEVVKLDSQTFTAQNTDGVDDADDSDVDPATGRTGVITLAEGQNDPTNDAGILPPAAPVGSISNFVWEDTDSDGIQDDTEEGVEGVVVNLWTDGAIIATTTTNADGMYIFGNLPAGDYLVQFVAPDGREFTLQGMGDGTDDSDAGADGITDTITLAEGENNVDIDAGITPPPLPLGSISDFVWEDTNGDGLQDGEDGVEGVVVRLLDAVGNVLETTVTDADGMYIFGNLPAGDYIVQFEAPAGRSFTAQDAGDGTNDSDAGASGRTATITLGESEDRVDIDAGIAPTAPPLSVASLGNVVFLDMNANGIQDDGEVGVPGIDVTVTDADGNVAGEDTTDADGIWGVDLEPGDYVVTFDLPAGYVFSPQNQGDDDAADSDADENGMTDAVTLAAGDNNLTVDAGIYPLGSIGNRVFVDGDRDGIQDAGEEPVAGATVRLFDANPDGTRGDLRNEVTTDSSGNYLFDELPAGDYILVVIPPSGYTITTQGVGNDSVVDSDFSPTTGESTVVTLGIGEDNMNIDAGLLENQTPVVVTPARTTSPQLPSPTITNAPPTGAFPTAPSAPPLNDAPASPPLAVTGVNSNVLATLAIAMMGVGGTMLIAARRERDK